MTDNIINNAESTVATKGKRLRWLWFPSLLFGDGLTLSALMLSMVMMCRLGLDNALITLYISLLCTPLLLRPLFEMIITHFRGTTKVWILSAEFISALSWWGIAFTLPTQYWLPGTLCFMPFIVMFGQFYNIATCRFYTDDFDTAPKHHIMLSTLFRAMALLFAIGILPMLAGNIEVVTRNTRYSWCFISYIMAGINFFLWLWHSIFLPGGWHPYAKAKDLYGLSNGKYSKVVDAMMHGFHNRSMLYFILLFILPEAIMHIVAPLFFIDAPHNGGLGLSPQEFGLTFGTIGIFAFCLGYAIGNKIISKYQLHYLLIPMAALMSLHAMALLYLSYNLAATLATISLMVFLGNAILGFCLTAYVASIRLFARQSVGASLRKAIAVSLCTATMVGAGLFSGMLQMNIGYRQFFILVSIAYTASVAIAGIRTFVSIRLARQQSHEHAQEQY